MKFFLMQEPQLYLSDIAQKLEEMTRYRSRYLDPKLERRGDEWRNAFRTRYSPQHCAGRNLVISGKPYNCYKRYVAAYETRGQRSRTLRCLEVMPPPILPALEPGYSTLVGSLGGLSSLRAVANPMP